MQRDGVGPADPVLAPGRPGPKRDPKTATAAMAEIEALTGDPNFMTSLARGLAVIKAFTEQRRKLTIGQVSQRRYLIRNARVTDLGLGAHDALGQCRCGG